MTTPAESTSNFYCIHLLLKLNPSGSESVFFQPPAIEVIAHSKLGQQLKGYKRILSGNVLQKYQLTPSEKSQSTAPWLEMAFAQIQKVCLQTKSP